MCGALVPGRGGCWTERVPVCAAVGGRVALGARAAAATDFGWCGDPRDRDPANGDALHPRGGEFEQVRDLGGRHQRAERWDERSERPWEPAAVQPLADDHPAAMQAVLPTPGLDRGGDRLAHLAAVR